MADLSKNFKQEDKKENITPETYPLVDRRKKADRRKFAFLDGKDRRDGRGRRAEDHN